MGSVPWTQGLVSLSPPSTTIGLARAKPSATEPEMEFGLYLAALATPAHAALLPFAPHCVLEAAGLLGAMESGSPKAPAPL
ncbi:hypothetical protein N7474_000722 [Penicillium riverlandense]|uniref:uncharacterized protein n=1 Tax=Penicillium riverlandense TaxID=1903569 RepID=UPI002548452D|nr:uncharacterized protein N7474_000722 [Penicillium riverlandense]KAJ5832411.1 hypothetical protein N7474_000722 [Penicillium riverlandense]